jgi:hypothetical protein
MRWKALIVLVAILAGVMVPPSLPLLTANGSEAAFGTLDICHKSAPALSPHGDMPCMNECPCNPLPLVASAVPGNVPSAFKPLLLPFQDERPPQA